MEITLHPGDQKKRVSATDIRPFIGEKNKNGPSLPHYEEKNLVHLVQNPVMTPDYSKSPEVDIIMQ